MSLVLKIAMISEAEEILDFERRKMIDIIPDETERELAAWNSRWRKEALNHYLPMGWSFICRDTSQQSTFSSEGQLVGYFIAQPLLFFDGNTQTLWVEHLQFSSLQARDELCDLAYRLSREKHLQRVIFPSSPGVQNATKHLKAENWDPSTIFIRTTKG